MWKWQPENFYNHCLGMRNAYQAWILRQEKIDLHTKEDPFWSPPEPGIVGGRHEVGKQQPRRHRRNGLHAASSKVSVSTSTALFAG